MYKINPQDVGVCNDKKLIIKDNTTENFYIYTGGTLHYMSSNNQGIIKKD